MTVKVPNLVQMWLISYRIKMDTFIFVAEFRYACFTYTYIFYLLKVNWNAETSWPLSRDFEALKTVSKEFLKNSFSFSRYRLLKSKNSAGQILGFHRFPKKYCRAISVFDVTDDLCSQCEADVHTELRSLFPRSWAPRKSILQIFKEYFCSLPCGCWFALF